MCAQKQTKYLLIQIRGRFALQKYFKYIFLSKNIPSGRCVVSETTCLPRDHAADIKFGTSNPFFRRIAEKFSFGTVYDFTCRRLRDLRRFIHGTILLTDRRRTSHVAALFRSEQWRPIICNRRPHTVLAQLDTVPEWQQPQRSNWQTPRVSNTLMLSGPQKCFAPYERTNCLLGRSSSLSAVTELGSAGVRFPAGWNKLFLRQGMPTCSGASKPRT